MAIHQLFSSKQGKYYLVETMSCGVGSLSNLPSLTWTDIKCYSRNTLLAFILRIHTKGLVLHPRFPEPCTVDFLCTSIIVRPIYDTSMIIDWLVARHGYSLVLVLVLVSLALRRLVSSRPQAQRFTRNARMPTSSTLTSFLTLPSYSP